MSRVIEDMDFDNLDDDEKQYLRDRPWLPQPPGDEAAPYRRDDWSEDDHETVPVGAGAPNGDDGSSGGAVSGEVDENGDPINLGDDGEFESYAWERMPVPRLKEFLAEYELPVSGNKADLVNRLREYDDLQADAPEE